MQCYVTKSSVRLPMRYTTAHTIKPYCRVVTVLLQRRTLELQKTPNVIRIAGHRRFGQVRLSRYVRRDHV